MSQQPCQKYTLPTTTELNFHVVLCLPHKIKPRTPPHMYIRAETPAKKQHDAPGDAAVAPPGCHGSRDLGGIGEPQGRISAVLGAGQPLSWVGLMT